MRLLRFFLCAVAAAAQSRAAVKIILDYGDEESVLSPDSCVDEFEGCAHFGHKVCFDNFEGYTGTRSKTITGRTCQSWGRQSPHPHRYTQMGSHNQCRITVNETAPFCFTTDPGMPWEYCFPDCSHACSDRWPGPECAKYKDFGYCTSARNTYFMGKNCAVTCGLCDPDRPNEAVLIINEVVETSAERLSWAAWGSWAPCSVSCGEGFRSRQRVCPGPDACDGINREFIVCLAPGCPTPRPSVVVPRIRASACVDERRNCAHHGRSECRATDGYQGDRATTAEGLTCQRWDSQRPHAHNQSFVGRHNFCRNPDGEMGPWCWTTEPAVPWQYCFPIAPCQDGRCLDRWELADCGRYRRWGYCDVGNKYRYWMNINCCQTCRRRR